MLIPRLISGFLLAALAAGVLFGDAALAPWYPCLFAAAALFAGLGAWELRGLIAQPARPPVGLAIGGVVAVIAANWAYPIWLEARGPAEAHAAIACYPSGMALLGWVPVLFAFVGVLLLAFIRELFLFRAPGAATARLAYVVLLVAYLGVLPSFLVQLRWIGPGAGTAIGLTIFVPKLGDVGAYFTGRFLGRHRMTPILSPKKTWEGFAGGMAVSVLTAMSPALWLTDYSLGFAVGFGLTVGIAGVLGDLAESLLKRDAGAKDAARSIPGFGGVLDVIDSVLFAAPVAYVWFVFFAAR